MKTLLIMAAGNGSRYGALKQFDNLGPEKEFLFEYSIFDAIESGFDHIVVITKREFVTEISSYLQKRLPANIKIDVIAGSSMGAIIGAMYALNPNIKELEEKALSLTKKDFAKLLDLTISKTSLIKGNKIRSFLEN